MSADAPVTPTFDDLPLRPELLQELASLGYEEPTPIQSEAIPHLVAGADLLGQAATGTGKTAAFALPLLERLPAGERGRSPSALVLVPTRELAMQVSQAVHRYGRGLGARVLPIYGGQPIGRQLKELGRGVDVVVATPGRALDHLSRGTLDLDAVGIVVLDEADEMLDMGFQEDLESILDEAPVERQTVLFSATMPRHIDQLARKHLRDPVRITIGRAQAVAGSAEGPRIDQTAYVVSRGNKPAALGRILDVEAPGATIVFCGTRNEVDELTETMNGRGYRAEALHGGMSQEQRDRVMDRLRNETADLLVATDVAARGLDIEHLTHVVNYDVPSAPENYTHRIGRVGRAGREGVAITLVEPRQHRLLKAIERHTGQKMDVARIPTVADLRARRMELTRAALREELLGDELDRYHAVVDALADEFDVVEIALAAVKLAHDTLGGDPDEEQELPELALTSDGRDRQGQAGRSGGRRPPRGKGGGDVGRVFIGLGRNAGIRPKDLVGAIANEAGVAGRDIGAIQITQNFSLVEVPSGQVDQVIGALRETTIKGRRATVRRDNRDPGN
ncbi:DEAD/DEAH box helicase [Egicoccus halophilus]|uniref:RNA helicase n=1 Tax=Egicoccus halophilus TaxID=1670830 RepID=A0A8J3A6H1_9ACTN|nr:DEAD/DEAH box helicase [Egicoccus halophilus]GGI04647.1 DEAD-box ATP-dependent RNA helicase CshA [Egicoccus halophilus]